MPCLLAIDQGTTSSRAILFDCDGRRLAQAQREFRQYYPEDGWVEHDATQIWQDCLALCREVLAEAGKVASEVAAIGITNQRETTVLWERASGKPLSALIAERAARFPCSGEINYEVADVKGSIEKILAFYQSHGFKLWHIHLYK